MPDAQTIQLIINAPLVYFVWLLIKGALVPEGTVEKRLKDKDDQIAREREVQRELLKLAREGTQLGNQGAIAAQQAIEVVK